MDNREFAQVLLCEAAELLNEASNHGAKGNTVINLMKSDENFADTGGKALNSSKIGRILDKSAIKEYNKALDTKNPKLLERIGKNARKYQAAVTTGIDIANKITKDEILNDPDYSSAVKGLKNKKPIKDKAEMRKNNIKLGYQIAKNYSDSDKRLKSQNEAADFAILLTEAALLLNNED